MKLLIIRHGIAEEPKGDVGDPAKADAERRLTAAGVKKMRRGAAGLRTLVPHIDILASSPLVRAVETAEIVRNAYATDAAAKVAALEPGKPVRAVLTWVQGQRPDTTIALVGHEPQLGMLISWLLSGEERSFVDMRKGGACLLEFEGRVRAGQAKQLWLMKSSQLRELAGKD